MFFVKNPSFRKVRANKPVSAQYLCFYPYEMSLHSVSLNINQVNNCVCVNSLLQNIPHCHSTGKTFFIIQKFLLLSDFYY